MNRGGFTLLELMITIMIVFIVSMSVYMPYSHYQKKAEFNLAIKQVAQLIGQARNNAIYGDSNGVNSSFGIYMKSGNSDISLLSYPYNSSGAIQVNGEQTKIEKQLSLNKNITLHSIGGYDDTLLFYEAISGKLTPYYIDSSLIAYDNVPDIIDIQISYGDFNSSVFTKTLSYYTQTHVVDY